MTQQQVVAEWAWITKEPGSREDYGVLAASAEAIDVGVYVAGVPSSSLPEDAPMAPPWATFGSHLTRAGRPMLSVSIQDPWHGQDQARRPIWPRRFFICDYGDLAAARTSYRTLWEAVAPVRLPRPDRQPVPVAIRSQPLSDVVATINDIGFDRVAAIAAALLDGPVAVTDTGSLRLTDTSAAVDRLAVLDAVTALLPYGFRAALAASTAVDNTVAHRMRLILAEYPNGDQQAAPLRGSPPAPRSGMSHDYLTMLLDKERWDGLNMIVGYLRDAISECSFARTETALEILDGLNRYSHRIRAARAGTESLKLSQAFFNDEPSKVKQVWRSPEMDEQTRTKLLRPFMEANDRDLAGTLPRYWDVVADEYVALANRRLDDGDIGAAVRGLAAADTQPDPRASDQLLQKLVSPPRISSESWPSDVVTRAELLCQRQVPTPSTFGLTRSVLRAGPSTGWQGQLFRELLSREITADPATGRALAWASWLSGAAVDDNAPDWVAALGCVLTETDHKSGREGVRSLIQQDAVWAAILLELTRQSGRLAEVLAVPGLADDLVGLAAAAERLDSDNTRRMLVSAIHAASWEHDLAPATIASVDAVRLLLADQPSSFPARLTKQELSDYDAGLRRVLGLRSVRDAQPSLASRLLGQLLRACSTGLSDGAVWLLQTWSEDERLAPVLARLVAAPEITTALTCDRRLNPDFWGRLAAVQPVLGRALATSLLRGAIEQTIADPVVLNRYADEQFGVTGSKLALAMYRAQRSGMPSAQIMAAMRDTSVEGVRLISRISHYELDDVLREFEFLLTFPARDADITAAAEDRPTRSLGSRLEFQELICAGALGAGYGAEFWRSLNKRLRDEEATSRRLRLRLRRLSRPSGRWRARLSSPVLAAVPAREE